MPIRVTCSNCGGVLNAPDDSAGRRGRCPTCGTVLNIVADQSNGSSMSGFGNSPTTPPPMGGNQRQGGNLPPQPTSPVAPGPWGASATPMGDRPATASAGFPAVPSAGSTYELAKPENDPYRSGSLPPATGMSHMGGDGRRFPDPFSKANAKAAAKPDELAQKSWLKVRKGLGWIQASVFFKLIAILALVGVPIATQFGVKLPDQTPGYLGLANLSAAEEIRYGAVLIPLVLGLMLLIIGRFRFAAAPSESFARGPAILSSLSTVAAIAGWAAVVVLTGLSVRDGVKLQVIFPPNFDDLSVVQKVDTCSKQLLMGADDAAGLMQRYGIVTYLLCAIFSEIWFAIALGRMAAALRSHRAASRASWYVGLIGIGVIAVGVTIAGYVLQGADFWATYVAPKWNQLDPKIQSILPYAILGGVVFLAAIIYLRLIASVRRAITEAIEV